MRLYPAIDLKQGRCVRLRRGDMDTAETFSDDPAAQALAFEAMGFTDLHVIDLDAATGGSPNHEAFAAIAKATSLEIQTGGGLRSMEAIERRFAEGAHRVILGTAALRTPSLARRAAREHPDRVAIALDERDGRVAVEGWSETVDATPIEAAKRFADHGIAAILHTDVARDGLKSGINLDASERLARSSPIPVIASGGVASLADVDAILARPALAGAVIGRALYDGSLDGETAARRMASAAASAARGG